jgi:predicted metal-dependent phosphoesterase TrpH
MTHFTIDLHAHTTASDGTHSPAELVERAVERGLRVLGIADHDTIDGLLEAQAVGKRLGLEIVPGVEFSTRHDYAKHFVGIHLLGYFIDPQAPSLIEITKKVKQGRLDQKIRQIEKLQEFGFDIPVQAVLNRVRGVPGRPHIAAVLLERNPQSFSSIQQIFDEYLASGAKAHVRRNFALTVAQAIEVVKNAGGLPVIAHPGVYGAGVNPDTIVRNAKAEGVEGVEVYYPYETGHRPGEGSQWIGRMESLARELDLLATGGTDFHGRTHEVIDLGDMGLTEKQYTTLKQGWQRLRGRAA